MPTRTHAKRSTKRQTQSVLHRAQFFHANMTRYAKFFTKPRNFKTFAAEITLLAMLPTEQANALFKATIQSFLPKMTPDGARNMVSILQQQATKHGRIPTLKHQEKFEDWAIRMQEKLDKRLLFAIAQSGRTPTVADTDAPTTASEEEDASGDEPSPSTVIDTPSMDPQPTQCRSHHADLTRALDPHKEIPGTPVQLARPQSVRHTPALALLARKITKHAHQNASHDAAPLGTTHSETRAGAFAEARRNAQRRCMLESLAPRVAGHHYTSLVV